MSLHAPRFRPDLEGLRGAAILLVVLYHAGVPALAGGFVGVDVFFVLSGYLITGVLARELGGTGGVDLGAFYGRRALRLLPPLLVVLGATLALAWWLHAPIDRAAAAAGARAAALGTANVAFARGAVDYFSTGDDPLLHTWSLAVEQQFYAAWPPLLLFAALVAEGRRRGPARAGAPPAGLRAGVAAAGALSFAASLWLTRAAPPWAFFSTAARAWEFALGALVALAPPVAGVGAPPGASGAARALRARDGWGTALQVAGAAAVAVAVARYDRGMPYPGLAALLPALGAAALLAGGALAPEGAATRALALRPLRGLGRLSYAWYLWHWPLVHLGAVLHPTIGVAGRLAWSALALLPAWATYRVVEGSARAGRLARIPARWLPAAALGATALAALGAHGALRAAERRATRPDQEAFARARRDRMRHGCWAAGPRPPAGLCVFGDTNSTTTVALFGDSHAEHWLGALDRAGRERGWRVLLMVKPGCPVADVPGLGGARRPRWASECERFREATLERIARLRPEATVLASSDQYVAADGGRWDRRVTPDAWRAGLRRTYARLAAAGVPVVAVRDVPRPPFDVPGCLSRRAARLPFATPCAYDRDAALSGPAVAAQTAAARGLPVRFVDMNDQLCAGRTCRAARAGVVAFTDDNHLTASFSRLAAPAFGARLAAAVPALARAP